MTGIALTAFVQHKEAMMQRRGGDWQVWRKNPAGF